MDAQPISPEDIDRMNAEREQLLKELESLASQRDALSEQSGALEVGVQKKRDVLEKLASAYNFLGEKIAVIPADAANAGGMRFEVSLNFRESRADLICPTDFAGIIKVVLNDVFVLKTTFEMPLLKCDEYA